MREEFWAGKRGISTFHPKKEVGLFPDGGTQTGNEKTTCERIVEVQRNAANIEQKKGKNRIWEFVGVLETHLNGDK